LGRGTDFPLDAFHIKVTDNNQISLKVKGKLIEDVFFARYHIDNGYKLGVCAEHRRFPELVSVLTADTLLNAF
jgi:hypothetical protein